MKKYIVVLTNDERPEAIALPKIVYQKPICRTNAQYSVGQLFTMKLRLPDMTNPNVMVRENVLVKVEKIVHSVYFVKIPNTEKL